MNNGMIYQVKGDTLFLIFFNVSLSQKTCRLLVWLHATAFTIWVTQGLPIWGIYITNVINFEIQSVKKLASCVLMQLFITDMYD